MSDTAPVRIRRDLLKPAKQAALGADMTLTAWLSEAIREKLWQERTIALATNSTS